MHVCVTEGRWRGQGHVCMHQGREGVHVFVVCRCCCSRVWVRSDVCVTEYVHLHTYDHACRCIWLAPVDIGMRLPCKAAA